MNRFVSVAVVVVLCSPDPLKAADPAQPSVPDLVKQLETGSPVERVIAAEMLGELGPAAADAIPALAKILRATKFPDPEAKPSDPPVKKVEHDEGAEILFLAARTALVRIGPKSVPALAGLLDHESSVSRRAVAEAVGWFGADAVEAVPALIKASADSVPEVRTHAIETLGKIGPRAEAAIPALTAVLTGPEMENQGFGRSRLPSPKAAAMTALVRIGPKGVAVVQEKALKPLIDDLKAAKAKSGPGGRPGIAVLYVLGKDAAAAVPALKDSIQRNERFAFREIPLLLELGPDGVKAFQELLAEKKVDRGTLIDSIARLHPDPRFDPRRFSDSLVQPNRPEPPDLTPLAPSLIAALKDEDESVRGSAALALSSLGAKTPLEAIDVLVAALARPDADFYAVARVGKPAVPALLEALKSKDAALRSGAIGALAQIGCAAQPALPRLRELAADADPQVALAASAAATRISLDPKDAAPLARLANDPKAAVRGAVAQKLAELRSLATPHQKALIALLGDDDATVKAAAVTAVSWLGADVPDAVAALAKALPPPQTWNQQLYGGPLGPTFKPAVPALIKALSEPDGANRYTACRLIGRIGPEAKDAVPALVELLTKTRDRWQAEVVYDTLSAIGPGAAGAVETLHSRLPSGEAAVCLGDIGPAAKSAVPKLKTMLADPDPDARFTAAYALARIEGDMKPYVGTLVRTLLPPPGGYGTGRLVKVFDRLAPDRPEELIPAARKLLPTLIPLFQHDLVASLKKYGPAAKGAVPDLLQLLETEKHLAPAKEICDVFGAIGPDAKSALPKLKELLEHPELFVALAARDAIARIEGGK